jgi:hypothetical protein
MADSLSLIKELTASLSSLGIESPKEIVLQTHQDGMRFIQSLKTSDYFVRQSNSPPDIQVMRVDGTSYNLVEVFGIRVRWPAWESQFLHSS